MIYVFYNNDPCADDQGGGAEHFRCIYRAAKNSFLTFRFIASRFTQGQGAPTPDVQYISSGANFIFFFFRMWAWFLRNRKNFTQTDVFHFHRNYAAWPKYVLSPKTGRVIITYHNVTGEIIKDRLGRFAAPFRALMVFAEKRSLDRADRIIFVSKRDADALRDTILRHNYAKVSIIPAAMNSRIFAHSSPPDPSLSNKLVMAARLSAQKNHRLAIDSLSMLAKAGYPYTLTIAGDGEEREPLQLYAQSSGVNDRIKFIGRVSSDRVPSLLASHGIVLLTSHFEASPTIVKEAVLAQRPIVTTDVGDVQEWVDNAFHGFICAHSAESVTQGILKASTLVANGTYRRTLNLEDLSEDAIMSRVLKIYEELSQPKVMRRSTADHVF